MQLSPFYGTEPVLTLDGDPAEVCSPAVRQRRRLERLLEGFTPEQWAHPTRCEGWTVRDVVVHLESTNVFWRASIAAGVAGAPTQFLATFDPVASPAAYVDHVRDDAQAVLAKFRESNDALIALWESLDDAGWRAPSEAPPGHISASAVTHHALWDSWVHERDVLLPLGIDPELHDDEIVACLRYAAALGPALGRCKGELRHGTLAIDARDPDVSVVVDIGEHVDVRDGDGPADATLTGDAIELLEAMSFRTTLPVAVATDAEWMLQGLARLFDLPV